MASSATKANECRFLIKCEENRDKHISWILKSGFYFLGRYKRN